MEWSEKYRSDQLRPVEMKLLYPLFKSFSFKCWLTGNLLATLIFFIYIIFFVPNTGISGALITRIFFQTLGALILSIPVLFSLYLINKYLTRLSVWGRKTILFLVAMIEMVLIIYLVYGAEFYKKDLFVDGVLMIKIYGISIFLSVLFIRETS